jgi:hypothetical protein
MLGHVGCGTAVLAAEGQSLHQPQQHQDQRGREADRRVGRQEADQDRRDTHEDDRDQEGVLPADKVTDPAEDDCAERTDQEAGRVGAEGAEQGRGLVARWEEQAGEERGQDRVQVEVVPFEDGADGRRDDDSSFLGLADDVLAVACRSGCCAHRSSLSRCE